MSEIRPLTNLGGAMDLIKKSKNPLAPIYEAMTNSLEALALRGVITNTKHEISITLHFTGLLEKNELERIDITDNGIGFTDSNFGRFCEFFDKSKGYNNRGTGRLQYFHRFEKINIVSIFENDGSIIKRSFSCNKVKFIQNVEKSTQADDTKLKTTVSLVQYYSTRSDEKAYFNTLTARKLAKQIKNHFLLRFYLDNKKEGLEAPIVNIIFKQDGKEIDSAVIDPEKTPLPKSEGSIDVPFLKILNSKDKNLEWKNTGKAEKIEWAHFVLPEEELDQNGIYLCSKDIPVELLKFDQLGKNEDVAGNRYLTAFYGEVLDKPDNVSDSVDSFKFPEKKEIEKHSMEDMFFDNTKDYLLSDSIEEGVNKAIPGIYKDVLDVQEEKQKNVKKIAKAHGINSETVKLAKISLNDTEKIITKKLYTAQASQLAEKGYKAKQLFESLKELNPTDEKNYQIVLQSKTEEFSDLVDEQNKEELSRYVIRREMITDLLKKILEEDLDYQNQPKEKGKNKDREGLIHDLIFKRKSENSIGLNDLWVLNEEFLHFEGCSELPLNEIKTADGKPLLRSVPKGEIDKHGLKLTKRPDIFLYTDEEKCLIIELKEPKTDLSNHLNQMSKYCTLIANYSNDKISKFYCYLVGENINTIDLDGTYSENVNGDWIRPDIPIVSVDQNPRQKIATAQIEIIKLSSIFGRAHRRNKSFAHKLGLSELLEK